MNWVVGTLNGISVSYCLSYEPSLATIQASEASVRGFLNKVYSD